MSGKPQVPAIDGWHSMDAEQPHLIGSRCRHCHTYFFPMQFSYCKNPACDSSEFEEVELSRTGVIWSYTDACYQPPEPFVAADPFQPFSIAAVRLEKEQMLVLGQVASGITVAELKTWPADGTGAGNPARRRCRNQGHLEMAATGPSVPTGQE